MRVKRALLIGIDKYPHLNQLEGCVNDVQLMRSILQEVFAFPAGNITVLRDNEATRDGILAALDALVEGTGRDDIVVIHYAGHGSQMIDREGDEPDGMDETIVPFDSGRGMVANRDITDDEIHLRLIELGRRTSYSTLIFDSCHSGTITRDAFGMRSRSVEPDNRPDPPPSPIPEALWPGLPEAGPSGWMPLADQYVLLAGCRDEETSFEYRPSEAGGKLVHGALTYFLAEELRRASPGASYRDVFERAAAKVSAANSNQHPQMEGRPDRELFGVANFDPMRFVRVTSRSGNTATLKAGAAHGMTIGSKWTVYPQGAKRPQPADAIGQVEITAVRAVASDARVVQETNPGAILPNARAVESLHAYGELRLAVQLVRPGGSEPNADALEKQLEASPLLKLVPESTPASARIYLLAPRGHATSADPVPQLGALTAPTWAVVGDNGALMMSPKSADAYTAVTGNLEKLARYRQALALDNPDPGSALRGKVSLELLRRTSDQKWIVAEPEAAGGQAVFEEGEAIAFRVTSHHDTAVFINMLDFGLTGAVKVVYPPSGASERLAPGVTFEIGTRSYEAGFKLWVPKGFPYLNDPSRLALTEGTETLKVFVTLGEADFRLMAQQGVDPAAGGASPLMMLWQTAVGSAATRDIDVSLPLGAEDWATVAKTFLLRPSTAASLDPDGRPLSLGDATLSAPGLAGKVYAHSGKSGRAEANELTRSDLTRALDAAGVVVRQTIEITEAREVGPAFRTARGEPAIEVQVRDPGPEYGQMVMTTDELGVVSWHFAPAPEAAIPPTRETGRTVLSRTYLLPRTVRAGLPGGPVMRGLVGAVGRKFLKVMVFPLLEPGIGEISESFTYRWEQKNRPYRVRLFGPDDYTVANAPEVDAEGWKRLGSDRALLMLHGTFSRAHAAFGPLPKDFVAALQQQYGGRVFAFDHYTLSQDPRQNVDWLLDHLPDGSALDLDIICHSRGGLVSRVLNEKQGELRLASRKVTVRKVIFVGSPNAGTILADADHVGDFIDSYTNLLNFVPDSGVSDMLAGIITVAKQLAVGVLKGLPGLQSMRPGGEFVKWLNAGPRGADTQYFALASDYTPDAPGLREFAADRLMDRIFRAQSDLVVPTDGVFCENGSGFFPIQEAVVLQGSESVAHTGYFGSRQAQERILEWLNG